MLVFFRNRRATILYVDSPVGTGFSYLTNPDGYVTSEKVGCSSPVFSFCDSRQQMANDLYVLITAVLAQFPALQQPPFFVFGESYAGHYVPVRRRCVLVSVSLLFRPFRNAFSPETRSAAPPSSTCRV